MSIADIESTKQFALEYAGKLSEEIFESERRIKVAHSTILRKCAELIRIYKDLTAISSDMNTEIALPHLLLVKTNTGRTLVIESVRVMPDGEILIKEKDEKMSVSMRGLKGEHAVVKGIAEMMLEKIRREFEDKHSFKAEL